MKQRAAAVLTLILAMTGCATAPKPSGDPPELARARFLLEEASPASLAEASRLLNEPARAGNTAAGALVRFGRDLHARLFPRIPNPFPAGAATEADKAPTAFYAQLVPGLALLDPAGSIADLAGLEIQINKAESLNHTSALSPYLRGLLSERIGEPRDRALEFFRESFRRAPSFYPGKEKAAALLIALGRHEEALSLAKELAASFPSDVTALTFLARTAMAAGNPQEAADAAARAILVKPDDASLVILRAETYVAMGNWRQAIRQLDAFLRQKGDEPAAHLMKARLLFEKGGDSEGAMQVLAAATERFPLSPEFPEMRGIIQLSQGKTTEALGALNRAVELDPARVSTLTLLVRESMREGQWADAAAWLSRIAERSRADEHLLLGWRIATHMGDHEQALDYARQLAAKGDEEPPRQLMTRSLLSLGRRDEALQLIASWPDTAATAASRSQWRVLRAAAEQAAGDTGSALRDLRTALTEDPDNGEGLLAMADLLAAQKDYRKALGYLRQAARLDPRDAGLAQRVADMERLAAEE